MARRIIIEIIFIIMVIYMSIILFIITIVESLRAFRRARDGAAKGRGRWERIRWPDSKFEVAVARCALRNDCSPAQSFARLLSHSLAREKRKRGDRGLERPRRQGEEKREKRGERRKKMVTSSIPCISTVSRRHLDGSKNAPKKNLLS